MESKELALEKLMTIKEVSGILGKEESTIRKIGKSLFPGTFKNGIKTYLTEEQVTAIKLNLGKNSELPKTDLEKELLIQQAMQFQAEKVLNLQAQLTIMKPKADFYDQVAGSKDAIDIGKAANVLNIKNLGRNKLFVFLREEGILKDDNSPYREFIERGYFRTIEQKYSKPDGSTHINIKTVVYQKGLDFIRKRYMK